MALSNNKRVALAAGICVAVLVAWNVVFPTPPARHKVDETEIDGRIRPQTIDSPQDTRTACGLGDIKACAELMKNKDRLAPIAYPIAGLVTFVFWLAVLRRRKEEVAPEIASTETRIFGGLIDAGVFAGIFVVKIVLAGPHIYGSTFVLVAVFLYQLISHALFGQSLGKKLRRTRAVRLDGSAIGWPRAFLRTMPLLVALASTLIGAFAADEALAAHPGIDSRQAFAIASVDQPIAAAILVIAYRAWSIADVAIFLLNKERRALHDYLAGTKVVKTDCPAA